MMEHPCLTTSGQTMQTGSEEALTSVAKDKVQHIQVLALEDIPVLAMRVGVAVHDGGCGCTDDEHINPLGQAVPSDIAPGGEAQGTRLHSPGQAVVGQLHSARLLLCERG